MYTGRRVHEMNHNHLTTWTTRTDSAKLRLCKLTPSDAADTIARPYYVFSSPEVRMSLDVPWLRTAKRAGQSTLHARTIE